MRRNATDGLAEWDNWSLADFDQHVTLSPEQAAQDQVSLGPRLGWFIASSASECCQLVQLTNELCGERELNSDTTPSRLAKRTRFSRNVTPYVYFLAITALLFFLPLMMMIVMKTLLEDDISNREFERIGAAIGAVLNGICHSAHLAIAARSMLRLSENPAIPEQPGALTLGHYFRQAIFANYIDHQAANCLLRLQAGVQAFEQKYTNIIDVIEVIIDFKNDHLVKQEAANRIWTNIEEFLAQAKAATEHLPTFLAMAKDDGDSRDLLIEIDLVRTKISAFDAYIQSSSKFWLLAWIVKIHDVIQAPEALSADLLTIFELSSEDKDVCIAQLQNHFNPPEPSGSGVILH